MGSTGWNALLTAPGGLRERGAFEPTLEGLAPMPLARLLRAAAAGAFPAAAASPGWWRRPERFVFGPTEQEPSREARAEGRVLQPAS
ncbi:hypothetical protein [Methylobrevis pamukkalensis]|uniref:hypothetical protein n=1 Tax=Methylobrevis pamukkalensis TaxID=1439726 RepID=UPI001AECA64F|nr:hypothetical protein [Methylobrevis pamukkalensis]